MIQLFNTLSGKKEEFIPLRPDPSGAGEVRLYACGPTVYDYAHIGNFRTFVFGDLLRRFLESRGYKVKHVMNITDVDDKTIAGANREGVTLPQFTEKYTAAFFEDLGRLHILMPNYPEEPPRATCEIPEMINLVKTLIAKGYAYESEGSVYYRVARFSDYGKLSKKKLDMNREGARVDVDEYDKNEGADFVLWKKSKEKEPSWDSPWGKGRPGWHLECSAMSMKYLGETFDIHIGGEDLIFPHHENEIAQSEAVTGKPFVKYWLHCKFLLVDNHKMSKSAGNFYTLRDLIAKKHEPMAIRYLLLSVHYRTPLNFTFEGLKEAEDTVRKMDDCYYQCLSQSETEKKNSGQTAKPVSKTLDDCYAEIMKALDGDLNISSALAHYLEGIKEINKALSGSIAGDISPRTACAFFEKCDQLFGFDIASDQKLESEVAARSEKRDTIRALPEFKKDKSLQKDSDQLRSEIEQLGWLVKDARPGQRAALKRKRRVWDV